MLKKETWRVLSLPPVYHTLGIRVLWSVLWHVSHCSASVTPRLGLCHLQPRGPVFSWASVVLIATEINEPGLWRGSREDGSIAGAGRKYSWCWGVLWKAMLDLGWEVWPWPLQLILSVNRPLSSARKQREKCLFCFLDCGSEPVLPHQGLGTSSEVSRLQNASPKLPQMPAMVSYYTWIILADWIVFPASEWLGRRCVSQSL